jgi:hypothetical protein
MQRRAAAAYTAIFVAVTAIASYGIVTGRTAGIGQPTAWALASLSAITAIVLLSGAYMPVKGD